MVGFSAGCISREMFNGNNSQVYKETKMALFRINGKGPFLVSASNAVMSIKFGVYRIGNIIDLLETCCLISKYQPSEYTKFCTKTGNWDQFPGDNGK